MIRNDQGVSAKCDVCQKPFPGCPMGTSTELRNAMIAADWNPSPTVCDECCTRMHVWRNEGQPSDTNPQRRAARTAAIKKTPATYKRRRRVLL